MSFVPMSAVNERIGAVTVRVERLFAEVSKGFTSFEDGDILFAKITPCMENGKTALVRGLTNGIGRGSTEFFVLRPSDRVLGEYIYHFVRQARFRGEAKRNFTGTAGQQRVPRQFMERALIPLPSLEEQRRIVGILDRAAKIDRLQARARELIGEFKSSLFVKMFGDPDRAMGSGARCCGGMSTYPLFQLGDVCTITGGGTPRRTNSKYFGGPFPWATPTDVTALSGLTIERTKETLTEVGLRESSARLVPAGTVLLTSRATIGFAAIAALAMTTNQGFANLTCGQRLLPEYLAFWLRLRRDQLIRLAGGTTFKEVTKSTLKKVQIPLPPLDEQRKFADILIRATRIERLLAQSLEYGSKQQALLMARLLESGVSQVSRVKGEDACW